MAEGDVMTPFFQEAHLHARTAAYRSAVARTERILDDAFQRVPSWYVSLSGGKDSTVVLSLCRQRQPGLPAVAFVQRWMLPETVTYLQTIPNRYPVASRDTGDREYRDGRWRDEAEARSVWADVTWLPWHDAAADHRYGRDEAGAFLGLRADESRGRRMNARTRGANYYNETSSQHICTPIVHWSVRDVWAYLVTNEVPYNAAYDVLAALGVPLDRQRVAEFAVERVIQYGTLATLKRGWPQVWNAFVEEHPEVSAYV
jgi:3'-phosphoadenosine 5'-phosphosulfate sulfotransferase (PAPS reductase)/FAD synthetase